MPPAPLPPHESERIEALAGYQIMDTPPDPELDSLVQTAAAVCEVPIALVSLVGEDRQWFKAKVGLDVCETSRDQAFCAYAVLDPSRPLIVPDAQKDPRFADNPLVTGDPYIRFYAGIPLNTPKGHCLGTLCVIDLKPRTLAPEQLERLQSIARQVMDQFELRRAHLKSIRLSAPQPAPQPPNPNSKPILMGLLVSSAVLLGLSGLTWHRLQQVKTNSRQAESILLTQDPSTSSALSSALSRLELWILLKGAGSLLTLIILFSWLAQKKMAPPPPPPEPPLSHKDQDLAALVLNSVATLVLVIDGEGRIQRFNKICEQVTGYSMTEVLGKPFTSFNLFGSDSQAWANQALAKAIQTGQFPPTTELYWYHKDGSKRLIRCSNSAVFDENGRLEYVFAVGVDITTEKAATEALSESEERYRDLFENANDMIQSVDLDGFFLYVNNAWRERMGYKPDEVWGINFFKDVLHPKSRTSCQAQFRRAISGEKIDNIEAVFVTKNGDAIAVEGTVNVHKRDGKPDSLRGILRDVTDRKQVEQVFRQQSQRIKLFSDIALKIRQSLQVEEILKTTVNEVRRLLAADRVLVYQFFEDRTGFVAVESLQSGWTSLQDRELEDPCFQTDYFAHYQQGRVRTIHDVYGDTLSPCHIEMLQQWQVRASLVVPVLLQDQLWGLLIVHQCSGSRRWKSIEVDLLCQLADQMGIALSQGRLLQQEKEQQRQLILQNHEMNLARQVAEEAAEAKSIFLATMSHEVRTPLNAMLGMSELLQATQLSNEQQEWVKTLQDSGHMLLELVNGILDLSKLEARGLRLHQTTFDIRHLLEEGLDRVASAAQTKGLLLDLLIWPEVPTQVKGDPTRLRQIVDNLLSNAVKFTEEGRVVVEVAADEVHPPAETPYARVSVGGFGSPRTLPPQPTHGDVQLRIWVRDTGVGIALEHHERLFQPFSQLDGSPTRRYGGTGLGLALCRQLTYLMGGQIGFESQAGEGSSFWVSLPFEEDPQALDPWSQPSALAGKTLLVVTDPLRRQVITSMARPWGLRVESTDTLTRTFYYLQQAQERGTRFDAVIFDEYFLQIPDHVPLDQVSHHAIPDEQAHLAALLDHLGSIPLVMLQPRTYLRDGDPRFTSLATPIKERELNQVLCHVLLGTPVPAPSLPLDLTLPDYVPLGDPIPDQPRPKLTNGFQPHLLVVEDNPINRKLILRQLHNLGLEAAVATNGQEALDYLEQMPCDIVLMDCMMPVMDGYSATHALRQQGSRVKIIAVTANALPEDRERCIAAGMDDYLSKPISTERLEAILRHWIQIVARERTPTVATQPVVRHEPRPEDPLTQPEIPAPGVLLADQELADQELEDPGHEKVIEVRDPCPINRQWLQRISEGDRAFEQELIQVFVEDALPQRDMMKVALADENWSHLRELAHRMKGAGGNIGAERIQQLSTQLEDSIKLGDVPQSGQHLEELDLAIDALVAWMQEAWEA